VAGWRRYSGPKGTRVSITSPSGEVVLTRSKLEAMILNDLTQRKVSWEYEPVKLAYTVTHHYTPDAVFSSKKSRPIYLEIKGQFTPADRSKALAVREQNPDVDIRFVFQRGSTTLSKASSTTYVGWCDKHKFKSAEGRVPDAWTKE